MIRIRSLPDDPELEAYRTVGDPAALERAGLFVAEGRLVVERLLQDGRFRIHSVAVTPAAASALGPLLEARPDVPVHVCEPTLLQTITGFDFHRGCLALAWRDAPATPVEAMVRATRLLALEGVGNPDNIGGLFRTALAFGVEGVLLDSSCGDPLYRKAIRTSMAATLRVPFVRIAEWPHGLDRFRRNGFRVLALTPHRDAAALEELRVTTDEPIVLAAGSEGAGLSSGLLDYADVRVRIPMDVRADSLNVVVAAAIALHALRANC